MLPARAPFLPPLLMHLDSLEQMSPAELADWAPRVRNPAEALALLEQAWRWIGQVGEEQEAEAYYEQTLASLGRVDDPVMERALHHDPFRAHRLLENPQLGVDDRKSLLGHFLAQTGEDLRGAESALRGLEGLRLGCQRGWIAPGSPEERELQGMALEEPADLGRLCLASCLAESAALTREVLDRLFEVVEQVAHERHLVERFLIPFIQHPQAHPALWRRALEMGSRNLGVLHALAERREARRDPIIRAHLAGENPRLIHLQAALALDLLPGSRERFQAVLRRDPQVALGILEHPEFEAASELAPEDLTPLFSSPESEVRLRAIAAYPQALERARRQTQEAAEPAPAPRRR